MDQFSKIRWCQVMKDLKSEDIFYLLIIIRRNLVYIALFKTQLQSAEQIKAQLKQCIDNNEPHENKDKRQEYITKGRRK